MCPMINHLSAILVSWLQFRNHWSSCKNISNDFNWSNQMTVNEVLFCLFFFYWCSSKMIDKSERKGGGLPDPPGSTPCYRQGPGSPWLNPDGSPIGFVLEPLRPFLIHQNHVQKWNQFNPDDYCGWKLKEEKNFKKGTSDEIDGSRVRKCGCGPPEEEGQQVHLRNRCASVTDESQYQGALMHITFIPVNQYNSLMINDSVIRINGATCSWIPVNPDFEKASAVMMQLTHGIK